MSAMKRLLEILPRQQGSPLAVRPMRSDGMPDVRAYSGLLDSSTDEDSNFAALTANQYYPTTSGTAAS